MVNLISGGVSGVDYFNKKHIINMYTLQSYQLAFQKEDLLVLVTAAQKVIA